MPLEPIAKRDPWDNGLPPLTESTTLQQDILPVETSKSTSSSTTLTSNLHDIKFVNVPPGFEKQAFQTPAPVPLQRQRTIRSSSPSSAISTLKHYKVSTFDEREQQRLAVQRALEMADQCGHTLYDLLLSLTEDD